MQVRVADGSPWAWSPQRRCSTHLILLLVLDVGRVVQVVAVVKLGAVGRRSLLGRLVIVYRHGYDFSCVFRWPPSARGPIWMPWLPLSGRPEGEFRPLEANFDSLPKVTDGAKTSAKRAELPTRRRVEWTMIKNCFCCHRSPTRPQRTKEPETGGKTTHFSSFPAPLDSFLGWGS